MIEKIQIVNTVPYVSGIELSDLKSLNFIYGSNGSGKTVLSRAIKNSADSCQITWQNNNVLSVKVYNKDFVEENFNESELKGIFTLGEQNIENGEKIKEQKTKLENISNNITLFNTDLHEKNEKLGSVEKEFKDKCWEQKTKYDQEFFDAFKGYMGSKEVFKERCLNQTERTIVLRSCNDLKNRATSIFASPHEIESCIPFIDTQKQALIAIETNFPILQKPIIGKKEVDIAALIEKLHNSDWVKHGKQYYEQLNNSQCPFCQQKTTELFQENLEKYFDQTFEEEIEEIKNLHTEYYQHFNFLKDVLNNIATKSSQFLDLGNLENNWKDLEIVLNDNQRLLEEKINQPSKIIQLKNTQDLLNEIDKIISDANKKIKEHNAIVSDIKTQKKDLIDEIWQFIYEELKKDIGMYNKE